MASGVGTGKGSPPPTAGGSEARRPRHFSQDLPAPRSSLNARSPLSHAPSFPPSLMPASTLRFLAALMRRQPHRQAGVGWAGLLCRGGGSQPPACLPLRLLPLWAPRHRQGQSPNCGAGARGLGSGCFWEGGGANTGNRKSLTRRGPQVGSVFSGKSSRWNLEGANLQMLRNHSLLGRGRGPQPIDREVRLRKKHKPGARKSWICPHPAPRHWPPSRRSRPTRCGPPRKTHTLGPWFTTLIEYPNYSVQIENTVFSYKCIVK